MARSSAVYVLNRSVFTGDTSVRRRKSVPGPSGLGRNSRPYVSSDAFGASAHSLREIKPFYFMLDGVLHAALFGVNFNYCSRFEQGKRS